MSSGYDGPNGNGPGARRSYEHVLGDDDAAVRRSHDACKKPKVRIKVHVPYENMFLNRED